MLYVTPDEIRTVWIKQLSTSDESALALVCGAVSRGLDAYANRRFYTTTGDETVSFDVIQRYNNPAWAGFAAGSRYGGFSYTGYQWFECPVDIASITTLELAESSVKATSGTFATISTGDYYLQPSSRVFDGWPAQYIELTDEFSGTYNSSAPFMWFSPGFRTVRITGKFGWNTTSAESTAFPQEVRAIAAELAVKMWRSRESGFSGGVGVNDVGLVTVERMLSPWARDTLDRYRRATSR